MKTAIDTLSRTRAFLLSITAELSLDELNMIPPGFSNNIIWNMGHLVAAAEMICYKRAGLQGPLDDAFVNAYKPGSAPAGTVTESDVAHIKMLMVEMPKKLADDYERGVFNSGYTAWTTRYGVEIKSVDDAIQFVGYHEGMHTGYIMALKRVIAGK